MSAGTGIRHSEYNASNTDQVHMLQIWIMPNQRNVAQVTNKKSSRRRKDRQTMRIARGTPEANSHGDSSGEDDSVKMIRVGTAALGRPAKRTPNDPVTIHADADLYVSVLKPGEKVTHTLAPNRHAWLQVTKGEVEINGKKLNKAMAPPPATNPT